MIGRSLNYQEIAKSIVFWHVIDSQIVQAIASVSSSKQT